MLFAHSVRARTAPTEVTRVDVLGLTVRAVDMDSIRLRWQSQPGDESYCVYESSSAFGPFDLLMAVDTNRATLPVGDVLSAFFRFGVFWNRRGFGENLTKSKEITILELARGCSVAESERHGEQGL